MLTMNIIINTEKCLSVKILVLNLFKPKLIMVFVKAFTPNMEIEKISSNNPVKKPTDSATELLLVKLIYAMNEIKISGFIFSILKKFIKLEDCIATSKKLKIT